jgi:hypothetical protein
MLAAEGPAVRIHAGLHRGVWTRVFCHSSLSFGAPVGILRINDNWGVE